MSRPSEQRRFTLMEFIVIVVIVGLVVAITITRFINRQDRIKVNAARKDVSAMVTALNEFNRCYATYNIEFEHNVACTITSYSYFRSKLVDTTGHPYRVPDTANFTNFMYIGDDTSFTITVKARDRKETKITGTPEETF